MGEFVGPFLGFTFDDIHSSELNIVRVASSDRYTDNLAPDIQDVTVSVPNGDGVYYFGTTYGKKNFSINIAFDSLTEKELVRLRKVFNGKGLHRLVFDEAPYKYYTVKVTSTPNLSYVPFEVELDEGIQVINRKADLYGMIDNDFYEGAFRTANVGRIYKGEGTIQFTAFEPYAHSTYKYRDELYKALQVTNQQYDTYDTSLNIGSLSEWYDSRDWVKSTYIKNDLVIDQPGENGCVVYNAGDVEAPFIYKLFKGQTIDRTTYSQTKSSSGNASTLSVTESWNDEVQQWEYSITLNTPLTPTEVERLQINLQFPTTTESHHTSNQRGLSLHYLSSIQATRVTTLVMQKVAMQIPSPSINIPQRTIVDVPIGDITLNLNESSLSIQSIDSNYQINMKLHLIEEIDENGNPTGIVYNQYITGGDFFNLPTMDQPMMLTTTGVVVENAPEIKYDYLYY